jgi:anti-sigma factor RsiW
VTLSCGRARRLLWPDTGPRQATADIVAAREHVSGCEECQRFLRDMQRVGEQIGRIAPRPTAPSAVRDRLFKVIARARTDSGVPAHTTRFRQMIIAGIAALLVVGFSLLGYLAMRGGAPERTDPLGSIVADQLRSQKGAGLVSSDSLGVAHWLAERLSFAVQIPLFPEARLTGARLLVENREAGAVVEYDIQGRHLTYYVFPGSGVGPQREIRLASLNGYRMASWHDAGLTHTLVASLPGPKLIELARYCIHQMVA